MENYILWNQIPEELKCRTELKLKSEEELRQYFSDSDYKLHKDIIVGEYNRKDETWYGPKIVIYEQEFATPYEFAYLKNDVPFYKDARTGDLAFKIVTNEVVFL